jgi:PleD family two-component response regulator
MRRRSRLFTVCAVLQRMAEHVDAMAVPGLHGRRITFSAGLARRRAGEPCADTISRADRALYQAKEAGRDRIVLAAGGAAPERRYGSR